MKKRISAALLLLLSSITLSMAQTKSIEKIIINAETQDTCVLTVYHPERPSGVAVVNCPGGGYSHLSMQNEGSDWAPFYNDLGITFAVLKYRMPNGDRTIPMSDAQEAIKLMRAHKKDWHINPKKVGIIGYSAGGHLAATTSTLAPPSTSSGTVSARPNFHILFYPVISMDKKKTHKGSCTHFLGEEGSNDKELIRQYSCQNNVTKDTPKALLIWVDTDTAVNAPTNVEVYEEALKAAKVPCESIHFPEGRHGFGFQTKNISKEYHDQILQKITEWVKKL